MESIEELEIKLEEAKHRALLDSGWKHTCATPGYYWLYEKALPDGRVCLMNVDMALCIQVAIDEQESL